jgi:hypothetical protein
VRTLRKPIALFAVLGGAAIVAAGCGSGSGAEPRSTVQTAGASEAAGALSAEARSAATGDIPDNQIFLLYSNRRAGYSLKYPEGWTQSGAGNDVRLTDKNNIVHIVIERGAPPTPASVKRALESAKLATPTLTYQPPRPFPLGRQSVVKTTYTTQSSQDPVTGRRVLLIVDRYVLANGGRVATVDLGTPRGVDNVDAYKMMIESFRWR